MPRHLFRSILYLVLPTLLSSTTFAVGVDFKNDLVPVLTKSGCNAGACHGAAVGRGGFKLSLYGGNPTADYDAIVRQLGGRRVNLADPERSLIVLKPTQGIEHEGGLVFDEDHEAAKMLTSWIRQGAPSQSLRALSRIEVNPTSHIVDSSNEQVALKSKAFYSDGTSRDVTAWTIFSAEDASAVEIKSQHARVLRRGRHIVVARYLNQVVPIELILPLSDSSVDFASERRRNFIDSEILKSLDTLRLPVSPPISDTEFERRITLDLAGRLPIAMESSQQSNSKEAKLSRAALVDSLLESNEFVEYFTLKLSRWLRMKSPDRSRDGSGSDGSLKTYHSWLSSQIRQGTGYDKLVRAMITVSGDSREVGPASFYRTVGGPREQAEFVSELFMGSRLRCANCHNHPLDRWTQDDYHGLAAIFAKIESGPVIKPKPRGEVIHPRTLEAAIPRIPGEYFLNSETDDGRKKLAQWLTDAKNPYFAKAIVNRLWKSMMGRGLVEPVDDFRATNPATHPKLLDRLAADFRENGYDLKHTLRLIANSSAYGRSANALPENKDDDRFYSHAIRRPLEPEVLADAISDVLGVAEKYGSEPSQTRAVSLMNPRTPSKTLDILGRCDRQESCETPAVVGGLPQKLHLFNGELLNARISAPGSRLDKLISSGKPAVAIIDEHYQVALGRSPNEKEKQHWNQQCMRVDNKKDERAFLEDFVWALMTSKEFGTNH